MGSLWTRGVPEITAAEADEQAPISGSIEMKGSSRRVDTPRGQARSSLSFWPSTSFPKWTTKSSPTAAQAAKKVTQESCVQTDPAFLRTVVRANSDTHLTCSLQGVECVQSPQTDAAEGIETCESPGADLSQPSADLDQEHHEVQLTIRIPRPSSGAVTKADDLVKEVQLKERQRQAALRALNAKTQEAEDLLCVVRELTESRNKLTSFRAIQGERLADLQHEYMRVSRVADLSCALSRENIAKAGQLTQRLNQVEEELARQKLINQQTKDRYARLKMDNMDLREKICLLERLDMYTFRRESACMVEFQQMHLKETY